MSLDELVAAVRQVLADRFPNADWASLVIHTPGQPNTVLTVTPAQGSQQAERRPTLPLAS